jgi:hyaluronan synthase
MGILYFVPYMFLVLWALRFIGAMVILLVDKDVGLKRDYTHKPTISIIISCFREGEAIYHTIEAASRSNYPADKFEIVVYDDQSGDDSFEWMLKAQHDFPNVKVFLNEVNFGKGKTVVAAVTASTSDLIVTIDSDTILDKDALTELAACFSDPKMGLVGGVVGISNPDVNALTAFQVYIYYVMFRLAKVPEAYFKSVACVSGCMSAIRRSVFMEIKPKIEARNWFGIPVRYGEDRFITHETLLHGYDTYTSLQAKCRTNVPTTFNDYWGQQLRWQRSGVENFFNTLFHLYMNVKKCKLAALYTYFLNPLTIFFAYALVLSVPITGLTPLDLVLKSAVYVALSFVAIWCVNTFHPEQAVRQNPLRVCVYGAWWLVRNLFMTPMAIFTLDSDGWGGARNKSSMKEESSI